MADYYPLIARAVAGAEKNTAESRRALYERARTALLTQLRSATPALSESDVTRERLALEDAIRKVEAEAVRQARIDATRPAVAPSSETSAPARGEATATASTSPKASPAEEGEPGAAVSDAKGSPPREPRPAAAPRSREPRAAERHVVEGSVEQRTAQPHGETRRIEPRRGRGAEPPFDLDSHPTGRSLRPPPPGDLGGEERFVPPRRSYRGLATAVVLLLAFVGASAGVYWQLPNIVRLISPAPAPQPVRDAAAPPRPKIDDRIAPGGQDQAPAATQAGPAVAQRVVLYEEDPNDPQGRRVVGSAIWRTEAVSPGAGQPPDVVVKADIEVPERKMAMTFSFRRNSDQALPASHTAEVIFKLPADFPSGGVGNVPGILMKQSEQARGVPLAGVAVKVTNNYFLIALYSVDTEKERNIKLIKERSWFDIPIVYTNNRRAILAMEKGTPGERAFEDAFRAWGQ